MTEIGRCRDREIYIERETERETQNHQYLEVNIVTETGRCR